jgi:hypothetical protein
VADQQIRYRGTRIPEGDPRQSRKGQVDRRSGLQQLGCQFFLARHPHLFRAQVIVTWNSPTSCKTFINSRRRAFQIPRLTDHQASSPS